MTSMKSTGRIGVVESWVPNPKPKPKRRKGLLPRKLPRGWPRGCVIFCCSLCHFCVYLNWSFFLYFGFSNYHPKNIRYLQLAEYLFISSSYCGFIMNNIASGSRILIQSYDQMSYQDRRIKWSYRYKDPTLIIILFLSRILSQT